MSDDLTDIERALQRKLPASPARATQAELTAAATKYSTAAGAVQAPLAAPLTEQELKAGGGYGPAITSVDMTPRPRYGESRERFEARMARMGHQLETLGREVRQRNRDAALRHVELPNGYERWWTVCSCGFCGLRVEDPEVARREYDAHVCAAAGVGQAAVDRAIAETDRNVLVKRTRHVLQPSVVQPVESEVPRTASVEDDAEQRMALLELK